MEINSIESICMTKKIENSRHVGLQYRSSYSNLGECKPTLRMLLVYVELGKILPYCKLKELKLTLYCQVYKAVLQDGSGSLVYGCVQFWWRWWIPSIAKNGNRMIALLFHIKPGSLFCHISGNSLHPNQYWVNWCTPKIASNANFYWPQSCQKWLLNVAWSNFMYLVRGSQNSIRECWLSFDTYAGQTHSLFSFAPEKMYFWYIKCNHGSNNAAESWNIDD